jgi:alpha-2-macroglobulin
MLAVAAAAAAVMMLPPGVVLGQGAADGAAPVPAAGTAAAGAVTVQVNPLGTAKAVRQFTARFERPMVAFGDPRLPAPFEAHCAIGGQGRWIDARTWVYDFVRDLPGGLRCRFVPRADLRSAEGAAVQTAREYAFDTGGPAIVAVAPAMGEEPINEDQVFVLALDAQATTASVLANAWCEAEGINERIPLRIVTGSLRAAILARSEPAPLAADGDAQALAESSSAMSAAERDSRRLLVRCTRRLPNDREVRLLWGRGVATAAGMASADEQRLVFRTRPEFRARFSCTRANQAAQCIPVLPMRLTFSAPISPAAASAIRLRGENGRVYLPVLEGQDAPAGDGAKHEESGVLARLGHWWSAVTRWLSPNWHAASVESIEFRGPFPEKAAFSIELPSRLRDDAGRLLENAASFPLAVRTDEDPPLVRFAARFGVVEANAGALLPVTVRNIDAQGVAEGTEGRLLRVEAPGPRELATWIRRAGEFATEDGQPGQRSILREVREARALTLPRTTAPREFEVIGIPLERPGFYVVEFASRRLGAALFDTEEARAQREAVDTALASGKPPPPPKALTPSRDPYYVPATALVTNMAAHFKRGREGSLVWVTSLDRGEPVAGARVRVLDCDGRVFHDAVSDRDGLVRVDRALPVAESLPGCSHQHDRQLMVMASLGSDFTFTLEQWSDGIAPWRFNLPTGDYDGPYTMRAVLDRSLLRTGETVHMKLFARERRRDGFSVPPLGLIDGRVVIEHVGSEQKYEVTAQWQRNGNGYAQWAVPADARLGTYLIRSYDRLPRAGSASPGAASSGTRERVVGQFRVEAFRLPTMRATLKTPAQPLIAASEASVDVQLSYLSGGPAGGLPVRLRTAMEPRSVSFPRYDGFVFANGDVAEGVISTRADSSRLEDYEDDRASAATASSSDTAPLLRTQSAQLDASGGARLRVAGLAASELPQTVRFELEYRDANGETLTAGARAQWWPSAVVLGLRAEGWVASRTQVKLQVVALDPSGKPLADVPVSVDLLRRQTFSHRRRLLGGFYAFESYTDVARVGALCSGRTDAKGRMECTGKPPASGNLILRARASDGAGRASVAHTDIWIAGSDQWWFDVQDSDRMDVLPESPRYEPGQTARFQVRMPFRKARVLVSVEREGVIDGFVRELSGEAPVIELPVLGRHAPNIYVSVLAVRGRVGDVQPTATVDLGKPAFRMGIAEIAVGWRAHELQVEVRPEREVYRVRETARVAIRVRRADGSVPPAGSEIALAAVDEALLELAPNDTWGLLREMMGRRGLEVVTATAQMHVVGRRHFGKKAVLPGGGGGRSGGRELFDTLLAWQGRVVLDASGEAVVEVPLNDSLSSFRIVAIASAGEGNAAGLFGTGFGVLRTTQELMLLSGLPALARNGDRFDAQVIVRNASERALEVDVAATVTDAAASAARPLILSPQILSLAPGEARPVRWNYEVPSAAQALRWEITATESAAKGGQAPLSGKGGQAPLSASPALAGAAVDRLRVALNVVPAVPVRTLQATIMQLPAAGEPLQMPVTRPADALPGRGGTDIALTRTLGGELRGVRDYMQSYPYTCLEQRSSRAIALADRAAWQRTMDALPAYLDRDGLARYFPSEREGSDVLTSYVLSLSHESGWPLPQGARERMLAALERFVQGRLTRTSEIAAADLVLRRLAALDALARHGVQIEPRWLESLSIEPQLWPVSALLDWRSMLERSPKLPQRARWLAESDTVLRARLTLQGTVMGFSAARSDELWWLMVSGDVNANRMLLAVIDDPRWREDVGRLARGALARQQRGRWNTTVANAWGTLAFARFAQRFESQPVAGTTRLATSGDPSGRALEWPTQEGADTLRTSVEATGAITLRHEGSGRPWVTVSARAAVPLREPMNAGYRIERVIEPVQQKVSGRWSVGDLMRVRLSIDAQAEMTWVVVSDAIPAGATLLAGAGAGAAPLAAAAGGAARAAGDRAWLAFEERTFEGWRGYWRYVPKGRFGAEFVVRLNQSGRFELPGTRVEAMYAPEVFGELPLARIEVQP